MTADDRTPEIPAHAIRPWREELLEHTLRIAAIAGFVALVPSVIASFRGGLPFVAYSDIAAYAAIVLLLGWRRLRYEVRAAALVAVVLFLGVMLLFTVGLGGASFLWLGAPIFVSILFIPIVGTLVVAAIVAITLGVCTALLFAGSLPWTLSPEAWFTVVGNYVAVTAFVSAGMGSLLDRVVRALADERRRSAERAHLISEIHHRVKNNLQTMVSLLRLHRGDVGKPTADELAYAEARVLAMAAAHEATYRGENVRSVGLAELARQSAHEVGRHLFQSVELSIRGDAVSIPTGDSVAVSLIIAELLIGFHREAEVRKSDVTIRVQTRLDGAAAVLVLELPNGVLDERSQTTKDVIAALVSQIHGRIETATAGDLLRHRIAFPIPPET
ncbi:MAG: histidine kinase dimerization/phosphoacceptor domain -containing protein [Spirochaetota bacterium]